MNACVLVDTLGEYRATSEVASDGEFVVDFVESTAVSDSESSRADVAALVGGRLQELLPPELTRAITDTFRQALGSGKSARADLAIAGRTVELTAARRRERTIVASFADVTDARLSAEKLAREEIRFRRIIEAVPDYAIFMLDPDGRVASWNLGAQRIKGYKPEEIIGRSFTRFYPQSDIDAKKPERALAEAARVGRYEDEGYRLRKDGSRFWANVVITPIRDADGTLLGFTKVTRDLTQRNIAEENGRALAAAQATEKRLEAITRVTEAALLFPELDAMLGSLAEGVRALLDVDHVAIFAADESGKLVHVAQSGDGEPRAPESATLGERVAARAIAERRVVVSTDHDATADGAELASVAAAPLFVGRELRGVVRVASRSSRKLEGDAIALLRLMADRMAWAIDRAHAYSVLADSEERFRSTFEYAGVGIAHFTLDGRALSANATLERMLGRDATWLRAHYAEVSHPDDRGTPEVVARVARGELASGVFEKRYLRADGSVLWGKVTVSAVRSVNGDPKYLVALLEDVTAQKLHDETLRQLLAREQAAVAEQSRARSQVEDALRGRDVFLSIAAHELRTPLTPMRLQVDAILRDVAANHDTGSPGHRVFKKIQVIDRQTRRLEALVANLLDTSRIAGGQLELHPEWTDVAEIVARVVRHYASDAESTGASIEVVLAGDLMAKVDRARVEQVVANLVNNSIRYGGGKAVRVVVEKRGGGVVVAVTDNGIGIAEADLHRIFERFERAASERHYGGLGLGLWITRRLVQALGGTIEVESALGRGSTFRVTLPIDSDPALRNTHRGEGGT